MSDDPITTSRNKHGVTAGTYELPAPGNPQNLTIKQHIRSKSCVRRFADAAGYVGVLDRDGKPRKTGPAATCFCALRAWDQRLEHSKWTVDIENGFVSQAKAITSGNAVTDHAAVTNYFVLWQGRAQLAASPLEDVELALYPGQPLTVERENLLERKGVIFMRPSPKPDTVVVPGRLFSFMRATDEHVAIAHELRGARWGVLRAPADAHFICPDVPAGEAYMPLTPRLALALGHADVDVDARLVLQANVAVYERAHRIVVGRPKDIERFHAMLVRSLGAVRRS